MITVDPSPEDLFLEREKRLAQTDLVLPPYCVPCEGLDDKAVMSKDPPAKAIACASCPRRPS